MFRIVAAHDGTNLEIDEAQAATLNRGDFFEISLAGPSTIAADQAVLVAQMSKGSSIDGAVADPFMVLVEPYDQLGTDSWSIHRGGMNDLRRGDLNHRPSGY